MNTEDRGLIKILAIILLSVINICILFSAICFLFMITQVKQESAKKVDTFDLKGQKNGWLMELYKEGDKTVAYLTAAAPGAFKGYHEHKIRASRYICIKGKMRIILYVKGKRQEHILSVGDRLYIPKGIPTGLQNIANEESWLINYPDPPYDPSLKDEQVDYTQEDLEQRADQ